jgi:hypothetical protein
MGLGERIAAKRQAARKIIEVQEWGEDSALQMWVSPLTCADIDKLQRKHKDFLQNMSISAMVDLIIQKAENKEGEKLFTLEDRPFLMREQVTVVSRVAAEMFVGIGTIEEHEKN